MNPNRFNTRRATAIILIAAGLLVIANELDQWLRFRELERQVLELQRKSRTP